MLTTVLIANSLLLAVLRLLGHKIDRLKVPFLREVDDSEAAREKTLVARWGRFVTAHAGVVFIVLLLVGLVLASTSALVRLGAADHVRGDSQAPHRIYQDVQGMQDVASVRKPQFNKRKTVAIVFVTPKSAPQDQATDDLVSRLQASARAPARAEFPDYVRALQRIALGHDDTATASDQLAAVKELLKLGIRGTTSYLERPAQPELTERAHAVHEANRKRELERSKRRLGLAD